VPVIWFGGSDLEATAYQVADNRTHEFATWDERTLGQILEQLRAEDALEGVGFSSGEIDDLLAQLQAQLGPGDTQDPGAGELLEQAVTRKGDLWILGEHRLLCGDSAKTEDVDRLLSGPWSQTSGETAIPAIIRERAHAAGSPQSEQALPPI
jgi:hypothetical protein